MKKIKILVLSFLLGGFTYGQGPIGNPPANNVNAKANAAWYRGGNNFGGTTPPGANIFGTMWNSPVYHYASSLQRMNVGFLAPGASLVGVVGFPNPMPANRLTRVAINRDGNAPIQRPLSLLHIGYDFPLLPQGGQRNWMDIGMMAMSGTDHVYLGMRQKSSTQTGLPSTFLINPNDKQDAVLNWGDNGANDPNGPDNLCFIYTAPPSFGIPRASSNDGREVMRMIHNGNVGLGPVFSDGNQPKSNYHMHNENSLSNWLQITNETLPGVASSNFPAGAGTVNANDGFRIGILGNNNGQQNGNALVYNQEDRHLLFSTNANTNAVNPLNTLERMRITAIGAPTELPNNGYGNNNPAGLNANITRVSISHNPANPVTRPLSLLHLGYNTGGVGFNPASTDGWRPWIDIGTFTSNGTDNVYVGLKQEAGAFPASDRNDAVINWGDNDGINPLNGPDNLRFIFTSTTTGQGNSPANTVNGLETARISPAAATTMGTNYGMMGIGDFSPGSQNVLLGRPVDAKLDIDGDLRIREIQNDNTLFKVLVADEADLNRVKWRDISTFASGLGNYCNATNNPLTGNYEIDMNGNNIFIDDIGNVNIGDVNCNIPQFARLFVRNTLGTSGVSTGIWSECAGQPNQTAGYFNGTQYGIHAKNPSSGTGMTAAVYAVGSPPSSGPSLNQWAGYFDGDVFTTGGYYPSETALKDNITSISNALETINKLQSVTFNFKNSSYPSMNLPIGLEYGVIAENVDTVLPDLVKNMTHPERLDSLGNVLHPSFQFKGVNYIELIPILIAGVKELDSLNNSKDSIIQNLDNRLQQLEDCLIKSGICNSESSKTINDNTGNNEGQVIELSNANAIILDQNLPNPFAEKTSIAYSIPDDVFEAQLLFYDISGRIIKQVDITERGDGKITVYGENLKNGIYTYSLIADGKLIATKKMVKQ